MEEIAINPLLHTNEVDLKSTLKKSLKKNYILIISCVSIGILAGIFIGYLSFGTKKPKSENEELLISKSFNNTLKANSAGGVAMEISVGFDINVDLNTLIDQIAPGLSTTAIKDSTFSDGSRFISCLEGGFVIAAYNHPTKRHSATAEGGFFAPTISSEKPPNEWAIAKVSAGVGFRKTYYNSW